MPGFQPHSTHTTPNRCVDICLRKYVFADAATLKKTDEISQNTATFRVLIPSPTDRASISALGNSGFDLFYLLPPETPRLHQQLGFEDRAPENQRNMMTLSNGNIFRVNSPHKGQWRRALIFSLICAWINGWVNNREAGDLRRHRANDDVTVMISFNYHHINFHDMPRCSRCEQFRNVWIAPNHFHDLSHRQTDRVCHSGAIIEAAILAPCLEVNSLQLVWKSCTHTGTESSRELQIFGYVTEYSDSSPSNRCQVMYRLVRYNNTLCTVWSH